MTYNNDGSLSFPNDAVRQLTKRIQALQAQVANGTFVPNREDDILSQALGTIEHPSQAVGGIMLEKLLVCMKNCQLCSRQNGKKRRQH